MVSEDYDIRVKVAPFELKYDYFYVLFKDGNKMLFKHDSVISMKPTRVKTQWCVSGDEIIYPDGGDIFYANQDQAYDYYIKMLKKSLVQTETINLSDEHKDNVNHPSHYNQMPNGIEAIDVCEHLNFNRGNAIKYIWRAGHKNDEREDLHKALFYIEREILRLESLKRNAPQDT